ncbi:hypothetical protein U0070_003922, partial [Myodes glareolus]
PLPRDPDALDFDNWRPNRDPEERSGRVNQGVAQLPWYVGINMDDIAKLKKAVAMYGPQSHYTKELLNGFARTVDTLAPEDWKVLARALLKDPEYLQWQMWFANECADKARQNAASNNPRIQVISYQMLMGTGAYDDVNMQANTLEEINEQLREIAKEATMKEHNITVLTEFILTGITESSELQAPLFGLFLAIYMTPVIGNLGIIIVTTVDYDPQTAMYFILRYLTITDLGYSTFLAFFLVFIGSEQFILSAMPYDRYVAIVSLCFTLSFLMSRRVYWLLMAMPCVYCTFIFTSSFCGYNVIHHFYCDCIPLLSLLCSNAEEIAFIVMIFAAFDLIVSLLVVLVSYMLTLTTVLRINFAEGWPKAFSTCGSHLAVVTVFYGTLMFMYVQPKTSHSTDTDKMSSIFYTLLIPVLNSLIYTLRNK